MELHTEFQHFGGMQLQFRGDDDVWAFVNDSLVMDIGGVHYSMEDTVKFDDLPLTYGQTYPFDFFYCERRTWESHLKIVTNLPMARPAGKLVAKWSRDYGAMD